MEEVVVIKKRSKLGIASISIVIFVMILWIFIFTETFSPNSPWIFAPLYLTLCMPTISFILGLFGLMQNDRKRIFPLLGTIVSIFEFILSAWIWSQVG